MKYDSHLLFRLDLGETCTASSSAFGENLYSRLASVLNWHMFVYTDLSRMMILVYAPNKNTEPGVQWVCDISNASVETNTNWNAYALHVIRKGVARFFLFHFNITTAAVVQFLTQFSRHSQQFSSMLRLTCGDVYFNLIRCQRSVQYFARWFSTFKFVNAS